MSRRAALIGAALVLATASTGIAVAAPSPTGVVKSQKRVCAQPSGHFAQCHAHVVTNAKTAKPLATVDYQGGFSPAQLQSVYRNASGDAGVSSPPLVAVVDAYASPNAAADLAVYRNQFGLGGANFTQVNQDGGPITTVSGNVGWGQEEMLDLEMVSAMCPGCPILYVGANSNSFLDLSTAVKRAKTLGAKVISNSYGGNEFSQETSSTYSDPYNVSGVAVTVSSGDSGYGTEFPAAAKNVIAVGGTRLVINADGSRTETVWSGAGSGCSAYVGKPGWQSTSTGCSRRMVADIAAVADPNTGVAVYDSYGSTGGANWMVFGGTSVAAPLVGALYAYYGVPTPTAGAGAGFPVANAWANRASLFDVRSGSNGRCTRGKTGVALWCNGTVGYDGPTGNGTPNSLSAPF